MQSKGRVACFVKSLLRTKPYILSCSESSTTPPPFFILIPEEYYHRAVEEAAPRTAIREAYLFEQDGQIAGYGTLAKTFSTEAGGLVIWLEEVYIRQEFRGSGLGSRFFRFIEEMYEGTAARLRLEVEPDQRSGHPAVYAARLRGSPLPAND